MKFFIFLLFLASIILIGCKTPQANVLENQSTSQYFDDTPLGITNSVLPSKIPVTLTSTLLIPTKTPNPISTFTYTPIPTETSVPTLSIDYFIAPRESGTYLVYKDIAPGIWCPIVPESQCTWYVYYPGRVFFKYGSGRGCMTISQVAELVKWGSVCGPWEYKRLESYMTPLTDLPSNENQLVAQHPPGEYLVSIHIAPGIWKVEGTQTCEWAVFDITSKSFQDGQGVTGKFTLSEDAFWVRIGKDCYGASFLHE